MEKLREMSLDGLPEIRHGVSGKIYQIDEKTIVKVYNPNYPPELVDRLIDITNLIYDGGIKTPRLIEHVTCDGQPAIVFEFLTGLPLTIAFLRSDADKREDIARRVGRMMRQLHSLQTKDAHIPDMKQMYDAIMARIPDDILSAEHKKELTEFVLDMPGSYVIHGDFHMDNMIMQDDEIYLIDLDSVCIGAPLFEFAQFYCIYNADFPDDFRNELHYYKKDQEMIIRCALEEYFAEADETLRQRMHELLLKAGDINRFVASALMATSDNRNEIQKKLRQDYPRIQSYMREINENMCIFPWK